jgi:hypothetical protein
MPPSACFPKRSKKSEFSLILLSFSAIMRGMEQTQAAMHSQQQLRAITVLCWDIGDNSTIGQFHILHSFSHPE